MTDHQEELEQLRHEVAGLAVDEILAVCYAMRQRHQPARLRFYLDVLRQRGGSRAQFASSLICFDLARQGDEVAQLEFVYLADTIRSFAEDTPTVDELLGGDPYLSYVWELCRAQLEEMDPRFGGAGPAASVEPASAALDVVTLELLSDDDFAEEELELSVDEAQLWLRFDQAVEDFLGGRIGVPVYDPTSGFRIHNGRDVERVETFLRELESLRSVVPAARGFRALALLFYGTHIRSKSVFGAINQRKQELLRTGLEEFLESAEFSWEIAGVLGPIHADEDAWPKMGDVIEDYARWLCLAPENPALGVAGYDAVERLIARDQGRTGRRG